MFTITNLKLIFSMIITINAAHYFSPYQLASTADMPWQNCRTVTSIFKFNFNAGNTQRSIQQTFFRLGPQLVMWNIKT